MKVGWVRDGRFLSAWGRTSTPTSLVCTAPYCARYSTGTVRTCALRTDGTEESECEDTSALRIRKAKAFPLLPSPFRIALPDHSAFRIA